jgi:predicted nucleic acid-binding protein
LEQVAVTYLLDTNMVVFMVRGLKVRENPNAQQRERNRVAWRILERARKQSAASHIAAHALARGATLVTNDATDFSRVPGLKCEDWTA